MAGAGGDEWIYVEEDAEAEQAVTAEEKAVEDAEADQHAVDTTDAAVAVTTTAVGHDEDRRREEEFPDSRFGTGCTPEELATIEKAMEEFSGAGTPEQLEMDKVLEDLDRARARATAIWRTHHVDLESEVEKTYVAWTAAVDRLDAARRDDQLEYDRAFKAYQALCERRRANPSDDTRGGGDDESSNSDDTYPYYGGSGLSAPAASSIGLGSGGYDNFGGSSVPPASLGVGSSTTGTAAAASLRRLQLQQQQQRLRLLSGGYDNRYGFGGPGAYRSPATELDYYGFPGAYSRNPTTGLGYGLYDGYAAPSYASSYQAAPPGYKTVMYQAPPPALNASSSSSLLYPLLPPPPYGYMPPAAPYVYMPPAAPYLYMPSSSSYRAFGENDGYYPRADEPLRR